MPTAWTPGVELRADELWRCGGLVRWWPGGRRLVPAWRLEGAAASVWCLVEVTRE